MSHSLVRDLYYSLILDNSKYLTWEAGESNIILSAPHGGGIKPINIPKRSYGNRSGDTYTRRLTEKILQLLDKKPYFIYADIHRSRVDLNRDIIEGAQGNPKAEKIWRNWDTILRTYTQSTKELYGRGLHIDIHSHANSNKFQIGYGLNVSDYLNSRDGYPIVRRSTMYSLKIRGKSEYNTLFGNGSFPHLLEIHGLNVLIPKSDAGYLNGGRNIKEFSGKGIGSIQIECPISVLSSDLNYVAQVLAFSIQEFQRKFIADG